MFNNNNTLRPFYTSYILNTFYRPVIPRSSRFQLASIMYYYYYYVRYI
jgi:hypothetical protein